MELYWLGAVAGCRVVCFGNRKIKAKPSIWYSPNLLCKHKISGRHNQQATRPGQPPSPAAAAAATPTTSGHEPQILLNTYSQIHSHDLQSRRNCRGYCGWSLENCHCMPNERNPMLIYNFIHNPCTQHEGFLSSRRRRPIATVFTTFSPKSLIGNGSNLSSRGREY